MGGVSTGGKGRFLSEEENMGLGMDNHFPAVVKGDVEVPGEVTANNGFRAKHTDDCRI